MSDLQEAEQTQVDENNIFQTLKKDLNILPEDTAFDPDIRMHINSVLAKLNQLGVGPEPPLVLVTGEETWDQLYSDPKYGFVRSYIYLSVRLLFDPPSTTTMYEAFQRKVEELEWRLYMLAEDEEENNG